MTAAPIFFRSPSDFRRWLKQNHDNATELWVGYYKKSSGKPSISWPESVDEALCVGWIDGLRRTIDENSYKIRFTPRKAKSNWSAINMGRVQQLTREGRMRAHGLKAFALRSPEKSGVYAYENRKNTVLNGSVERPFRSAPAAWKFFQAQPASYRQTAIWWIMRAKKEETRQNRLQRLIAASTDRRRLWA